MASLRGLGLKNFRVFKDETHFDFAPITVLTGANNSGKSSVFKALMLLADNAQRGTLYSDFDFTGEGHNLASFEKAKCNFSEEAEMGFEMDLGEAGFCAVIIKKSEQKQYYHHLKFYTKEKKYIFSYYAGGYVEVNIPDFMQGKVFPQLNYNGEIINNDYANIYPELKQKVAEHIIGFASSGDFDELNSMAPTPAYLKNMVTILQKGMFSMNWEHIKSKFVVKGYRGIHIRHINEDRYKMYEPYMQEVIDIKKQLIQVGKIGIEDITQFDIIREIAYINTYLAEEETLTEEKKSELLREKEDEEELKKKALRRKMLSLNEEVTYEEMTSQEFIEFAKKVHQEIIIYIDKHKLDKITLPITFLEAVRANTQRLYTSQSQGTSFNQTLLKVTKQGLSENAKDFVNHWLKKLGIADELQINSIKDIAFEVLLIKNDKDMDLADLGYGVTQLLPILLRIGVSMKARQEVNYYDPGIQEYYDYDLKKLIVANQLDEIYKDKRGKELYKLYQEHGEKKDIPLKNPKAQIFYLEEPETNLHPKLQSLMADILVDACRAFNVQFIVETHSEYFIRKLQYLVGKKEIECDDVSLYYLYAPDEVPQGRKQVEKINVNSDGSLDNDFGKGFFDEAGTLSLELFRIIHRKN